jgi:hypothetical protein
MMVVVVVVVVYDGRVMLQIRLIFFCSQLLVAEGRHLRRGRLQSCRPTLSERRSLQRGWGGGGGACLSY